MIFTFAIATRTVQTEAIRKPCQKHATKLSKGDWQRDVTQCVHTSERQNELMAH